MFEGFKPEFWKGGLGGHLLFVCVFVCPRVVTRVLVLKGFGGPLFSVSKSVSKFVCTSVRPYLVTPFKMRPLTRS